MTTFDQEIMARTAIGEARGEGDIAMQAVMWVGMNRFTAKRWFSAASIAGTLLMKEQFSCWLQGDPNYALITSLGEAAGFMPLALQWASAVLTGMISDPTFGSTHYYDDSIAPPSWVKGATSTVKIGKLNFFKNVA